MTPATLWTMRACCAAGGLAVGTVLIPVLGGVRGIGAAVLATIAAGMSPQLWVISKRSTWREAIKSQLPDALDLMTIAMSAGSSFDNAIRCGRSNGGTPRRGLRQDRRGGTLLLDDGRARPIRGPRESAGRHGLRGIDHAGGAIRQILVDVLRSSETVRTTSLKVEEKAGTLSAKMVIPMIVFILPCFIIVFITPMILKIVETLG